MKMNGTRIALVAILILLSLAVAPIILGVASEALEFFVSNLGLIVLVIATIAGVLLLGFAQYRSATVRILGIAAIIALTWLALSLGLNGWWLLLVALVVLGLAILAASVKVASWIAVVLAIALLVTSLAGPAAILTRVNWTWLQNQSSNNSEVTIDDIEKSEAKLRVPANAWDLHKSDFEQFVKTNGSKLDLSSLRSPAADDWADSVLKGEGKALNSFADVEYFLATNPTYTDMIIRGLIDEKLPSGKTIGELNPWMSEFVEASNGEKELLIWVEKDTYGNLFVSKEYQKNAFLTWTLLKRFVNKGVHGDLEAAIHYPLNAMEVNGLPRAYKEANKPYTGEFVVLAYTQKGQECPYVTYGLNTQDGRLAILEIECDEEPTTSVTPTPSTPETTVPPVTTKPTPENPTEPTLEPKPANPNEWKHPEGKPVVPNVESNPDNPKTPEPADSTTPPAEVKPATQAPPPATETTKPIPVPLESYPTTPPPVESGLSEEPNEEPVENPFGP